MRHAAMPSHERQLVDVLGLACVMRVGRSRMIRTFTLRDEGPASPVSFRLRRR